MSGCSIKKSKVDIFLITLICRCPIFRPKSSEEQNKGHHVRRCPIFCPKSSVEHKKKVITSADVQLSAQNQVWSKKRSSRPQAVV